MLRVFRAAVAVVGAVAVGALAYATPAMAHVTVNPQEATQGGHTRVAFRVPTESDTASTTKLEVHLPEATPIPSVSTMPVPGWTVAVAKTKLPKPVAVEDGEIAEAVSVITWTAGAGTPGAGTPGAGAPGAATPGAATPGAGTPDTGTPGAASAIKPGEFQEFPVSLGPLPKVDRLVFKALQYYSDGSVVRWIEEPVAGSPEPEHPAPVLKLLPAPSSDSSGSGGRSDADDSGGPGDWVALGLGIAGLAAGLGGLALGGLAFLRTRRAPA